MSEGKNLGEALELLFTSSTPGWFTPFVAAIDGLSAAQAAAVPADKFNSVWGVVNHVRFWQEVALKQLQGQPVDYTELGSADGSGWPPVGDANDEAAWQAARTRVAEANKALAKYVAGLNDPALGESVSDNAQWNTRRHLIQSMIAHNSYHTCEVISIRHMQGLFFGAM
jgi:uncharacterized damage-inducible protein DinB